MTVISHRGLIKEHARILAAKPAMWGGRNPTVSGIEKLATACQIEWTRAVDQMLASGPHLPVPDRDIDFQSTQSFLVLTKCHGY